MNSRKDARKSSSEILSRHARNLMGKGFKIITLKPPRRNGPQSRKPSTTRPDPSDGRDNFATFKRLVKLSRNPNYELIVGLPITVRKVGTHTLIGVQSLMTSDDARVRVNRTRASDDNSVGVAAS